MPRVIARRAFLVCCSGAVPAVRMLAQSGKGTVVSLKPQHFLDAATEFDLYRLTDPRNTAVLAAPNLHFVSRRGRFLVHGSDLTGTMQAWRLDWHTGDSRQLTASGRLDPATIAITNDDRTLYFFDGPSLKQIPLANLRERELARIEQGWERTAGFALSLDGSMAAWTEQREGRSRVRFLRTAHGTVETLAEAAGVLSDAQLRPSGTLISYRAGNSIHVVELSGRTNRVLSLAPSSTIGQALWAPSGATLLYLAVPDDPKQLTMLREYTPDSNTDSLVAKTSQFASFGVNGDASVFVGASRSLASPYVLLLLRVARRELTLCEHRSSHPALVSPVFSPDSQSIFFVSDRNGKPAIYRLHVEKFVEETGDEPSD